MHKTIKAVAVAALIALSAGANAQTSAQPRHGLGGLFHRPLARPGIGRIVGNKRTHVYHLPGDNGNLPEPKNRVYFRTEAQARGAGYHRANASKGLHRGARSTMSRSHSMTH